MPLSKSKNAERMAKIRLHASKNTGFVQPTGTEPIYTYRQGMVYPAGSRVKLPSGEVVTVPELDADGNEVW